jgi:hypothetical protein
MPITVGKFRLSELCRIVLRLCRIHREENMLIRAEAYAKSASAVPIVVTGVVVYPVGYGERNSVEEHIAGEILVCFA